MDGALGQFIETLGGRRQRCLFVVIAFYHWAIQFAHAFDAFTRIGIITDYVAQAYEVRASACARVRQHCFERFKISVDITENCDAHRLTLKR